MTTNNTTPQTVAALHSKVQVITGDLLSWKSSLAAMTVALEKDIKNSYFNASVQDLLIIRDRADAALRYMERQGYSA